MANVTKVYDIVNTDRMAAEDIAAYNFGEFDAATNLENGRLSELDYTNKQVKYGTNINGKELWLIATDEKMYETKGLTGFINLSGKKVGVKKITLGDEFTTSACADTYADVSADDVMMLKASTGELTAKGASTPDWEFTVREKKVFGGLECLLIQRTK